MVWSHESPLTTSNGSPIVADGVAHDCYFLAQKLPEGSRTWHHPYSHATVAVILSNQAGEIALVERRSDEPDEGGKWALPGGYVELGQRIVAAALAEVQEETGYAVLSIGRFAILDGPTDLPGRANENDGNIVTVCTAEAGERVQDHDDEVTAVQWVSPDDLPPREQVAFGHYDIIGMWLRHQQEPFGTLPIWPSEMSVAELFPTEWQ